MDFMFDLLVEFEHQLPTQQLLSKKTDFPKVET